MSAHGTVRVLIVDDHQIVRTGLRAIISLMTASKWSGRLRMASRVSISAPLSARTWC